MFSSIQCESDFDFAARILSSIDKSELVKITFKCSEAFEDESRSVGFSALASSALHVLFTYSGVFNLSSICICFNYEEL